MERADELARENAALRERLSRLSKASLLINESLDFDTVLQGVLDSARALTEARYGVIVLLDNIGGIQNFLTSGLTAEEVEQLIQLPEGPGLFEYLGKISAPLRLSDFHKHTRALDLPEFNPPVPIRLPLSLLAAPLRQQGEYAGAIYVSDKIGGRDFSDADEEALVMFASQAAMVITNARRYREEQRIRADLETLITTSPVGVVVLNAETGEATSFNREAVRILEGLRIPGDFPEALLKVMTIQRADGWEYSLEEGSLVQILGSGETVRAEEIVLTVPDGRSVTALMNATPIQSEEGAVVSLVVTFQDMTEMRELERMRAEFLAMVSHELRSPLTSVKGSITTLLDPSIMLNSAETLQFHRIINTQTDRMRELIADLLDVARIETGMLSILSKPTEVAVLVDEARNAFQTGGGRHALQIDLPADLPWIMADQLRMMQVLSNLFSNAAKHSPHTSPIRVSANDGGAHVAISVSDEGRGIPAASLPHLFRKFSRLDAEDKGGDTGLGLSICKGIVEAHGGRIWAESGGPGLGARFTFTVPTADESGYVSPVAQPAARPVRRAGREQTHILAVDDDPRSLKYVRDTLVKAGYTPVVTGDPQEALALMHEKKPRLALLDLMLPGMDGIELMKEIRAIREVPVIFLSAYGQDQLIVRAFDMGAADYVVKPFSPTELAARIRGALLKGPALKSSDPFVLGELVIDYATRQVTSEGRQVRLTAIEYRMLTELSAHAGRILTYEYLLNRVWGVGSYGDLRPMRTVISTLRRKLGDDADKPAYIFTEPRVGYRMGRANSEGADADAAG